MKDMGKPAITRTPTAGYFKEEVAEAMKEKLGIFYMEQLISLAVGSEDNFQGVAQLIGMDDAEFRAIVRAAAKQATFIEH